MEPRDRSGCTAFAGDRWVASGGLRDVIRAAKAAGDDAGEITIFDDETGETIELDYRGTVDAVLAQVVEDPPRGPGRPRLGVVAREVTLLPRHWDWLNGQPGGASVALRKLVEEASRSHADVDRARRARDAAYRFLSTLAGDRPGYEEAIRALFAGDAENFRAATAAWPGDIRDHAERIAATALRA